VAGSGREVASSKIRFPVDIATHSTEQTLYFDQQGLLKRHDYDVEISGGTPAAHYVSSHKEFSGIVFPTKRRTFPRQPDGHSLPEPLVVSIDPLGVSKSLARSSCQRIPNMSDRQPPVSVFWPQPLVAEILNTSDGYRWLGGLPQDEIFSPCSLQKKTVLPIQPCEAFRHIVVAVNSRNESNHL
jgi:hypothetical protein